MSDVPLGLLLPYQIPYEFAEDNTVVNAEKQYVTETLSLYDI